MFWSGQRLHSQLVHCFSHFCSEIRSLHSNSLILVWQAAECEARHLKPRRLSLRTCCSVSAKWLTLIFWHLFPRIRQIAMMCWRNSYGKCASSEPCFAPPVWTQNYSAVVWVAIPRNDASPWMIRSDCVGLPPPSVALPKPNNLLNSGVARCIPSTCFTRPCSPKMRFVGGRKPNQASNGFGSREDHRSIFL